MQKEMLDLIEKKNSNFKKNKKIENKIKYHWVTHKIYIWINFNTKNRLGGRFALKPQNQQQQQQQQQQNTTQTQVRSIKSGSTSFGSLLSHSHSQQILPWRTHGNSMTSERWVI